MKRTLQIYDNSHPYGGRMCVFVVIETFQNEINNAHLYFLPLFPCFISRCISQPFTELPDGIYFNFREALQAAVYVV